MTFLITLHVGETMERAKRKVSRPRTPNGQSQRPQTIRSELLTDESHLEKRRKRPSEGQTGTNRLTRLVVGCQISHILWKHRSISIRDFWAVPKHRHHRHHFHQGKPSSSVSSSILCGGKERRMLLPRVWCSVHVNVNKFIAFCFSQTKGKQTGREDLGRKGEQRRDIRCDQNARGPRVRSEIRRDWGGGSGIEFILCTFVCFLSWRSCSIQWATKVFGMVVFFPILEPVFLY